MATRLFLLLTVSAMCFWSIEGHPRPQGARSSGRNSTEDVSDDGVLRQPFGRHHGRHNFTSLEETLWAKENDSRAIPCGNDTNCNETDSSEQHHRQEEGFRRHHHRRGNGTESSETDSSEQHRSREEGFRPLHHRRPHGRDFHRRHHKQSESNSQSSEESDESVERERPNNMRNIRRRLHRPRN